MLYWERFVKRPQDTKARLIRVRISKVDGVRKYITLTFSEDSTKPTLRAGLMLQVCIKSKRSDPIFSVG
jgi:hypothetical protein